MKIDPVRRTGAAGASRPAGSTGGDGFVLPSDDSPQVRTAAPVQATTAVDALLALQGVEGPLERRARRIRRAEKSLDGLDDVRKALLGAGSLSAARDALIRLGDDLEPTGDPGLDAVLNEIEVRRAVELAKLERR